MLAKLRSSEALIAELQADLALACEQIAERDGAAELLQADLKHYRYEHNIGRPNCPERVPTDQLQLAFERVLLCVPAAANDSSDEPCVDASLAGAGTSSDGPKRSPRDRKKSGSHGRRALELSNLPVQEVRIDPPDVVANPGLFTLIGTETSSRVGYRPASYVRLVLIRTRWVRAGVKSSGKTEDVIDEDVATSAAEGPVAQKTPTVQIAPLPPGLLPNVMAEASAIANVIVSKYDYVLPLHRQERISGAWIQATSLDALRVAYCSLRHVVPDRFGDV